MSLLFLQPYLCSLISFCISRHLQALPISHNTLLTFRQIYSHAQYCVMLLTYLIEEEINGVMKLLLVPRQNMFAL